VLFLLIFVVLLVIPTAVFAAGGFDEWGYNRTARIFNGTGLSWCMAPGGKTEAECIDEMAPWENDKLIMKWNAEWDRGNAEGWSDPPYTAWTNNEWNGAFPGGSGEVWKYKIKWIGNCNTNPSLVDDGAYCVWGQFEVMMDHGTMDSVHYWFAHSSPAGYGF